MYYLNEAETKTKLSNGLALAKLQNEKGCDYSSCTNYMFSAVYQDALTICLQSKYKGNIRTKEEVDDIIYKAQHKFD